MSEARAMVPGSTGRGVALAQRIACAGRTLSEAELLAVGGLALRAALWHPEHNPGAAWPADAGLAPDPTCWAPLAARAGVALDDAAEPAVAQVGALPDRARVEASRVAAARAAVEEGLGGVAIVDDVAYATGRRALELAARLANDPATPDDPRAWAALRDLAREQIVARRAAAVWLEDWALERELFGEAAPPGLRDAAAACRSAAMACEGFFGQWGPSAAAAGAARLEGLGAWWDEACDADRDAQAALSAALEALA